MGKKILITGGAGFIGSHIVDELVAQGNDVRVYDNLEPQVHDDKKTGCLNDKAEYVLADGDRYSLFNVLKYVEIALHEAATVSVRQTMYQGIRYHLHRRPSGHPGTWRE